MIDMSRIGRVVVRLPNWIGDAVMALPAINCIKRRFQGLHVSLLGKPSVNELYRYNPNIDTLIDLKFTEGHTRLSAIKSFSMSLREHGFDLGLVMPDSFSSALIFRLGGVRLRAGYRSELRSFLLTHPVRPPLDAMHRSRRYEHLVKQVLGVVGDCGSDFTIPISREQSVAANRFLDGIGRFAVICPTSRAPSRRWGRRKYAELMRRLTADLGLRIVLAGSADEDGIVRETGDLSGVGFRNLATEASLLLSVEVMRRSAVFVGNDSGAAHLAAAAGTRVVSISGADDPQETCPLARTGVIVRKALDCSPCVKNVCPRKDHPNECMDIISVDDVLSRVVEILGR